MFLVHGPALIPFQFLNTFKILRQAQFFSNKYFFKDE